MGPYIVHMYGTQDSSLTFVTTDKQLLNSEQEQN